MSDHWHIRFDNNSPIKITNCELLVKPKRKRLVDSITDVATIGKNKYRLSQNHDYSGEPFKVLSCNAL